MQNKKVTITDIAKKLNISKTTISFVLNNKGNISDVTRKRVLKAIEELKYSPSVLAKRLISNRSKILAFMVPDIEYSFGDIYYSRLLSGIFKPAKLNGYQIVIEAMTDEFIKKKEYIEMYKTHSVDGFLISGIETHHKFIRDFIEYDIPFIFLNSKLPNLKSNYVITNNFDIGFIATNYLIKKGHRKIVHLLGTKSHLSSIDRFMGYKKALQYHNIPFKKNLIIESSYLQSGAYYNFSRFFKKNQDFTAVFCANDSSAMGAYQVIKENGYKIGKDYSVLGVDDNPFYHYVTPKLSTVRQQLIKISSTACERFIKNLESNSDNLIQLEIPAKIIEKESVRDITF